MDDQKPAIFRRQVFFVTGFDPRGVLFVQKNCATATERWSGLTGSSVKMGTRRSIGKLAKAWPITAELPQGRVETDFQLLAWDDIIREHWEKRNWLVYLQSLLATYRLIAMGVYGRAIRQSWPIAVTMSVPSVVAILQGLSALMLVAGLLGAISGGPLATASGYLAMLAAPIFSRWLAGYADRFKPEWNARIGIFAIRMAFRKVDKLNERLNGMVDHILAEIDAGKADEALLIGHSYGTALASLLAARILAKRPDLGEPRSKLTLVTLGQTQSLIATMPQARWFRDELAIIGKFPSFNWLDFSAPPDGACYAMVNVLDFLDPPPTALPRRLNAQFHRSFSSERMNAARAERMIMHFFYLQSPDYPRPESDLYDFVMLIAGPVSAAGRYGARPSSHAFFTKAKV